MRCKLIRLRPTGPLQVGDPTASPLPADTLFGALCHGYRLLFGTERLEKLLGSFREDEPPFLISSAYPYLDDTLFFPWPSMPPVERAERERGASDTPVERTDYVDRELFEALLSGGPMEFLELARRASRSAEGTLLSMDGEPPELYSRSERPRVRIDRLSRRSQIYHVHCLEFEERAGLYFLSLMREETTLEELVGVLRFLETEGLGGERSAGYGQFTLEGVEEIEFEVPSGAKWFITLSPYFPRRSEVKGLQGYYQLTTRAGWIFSPEGRNLRKRRIRVFREGSVFQECHQRGELVDVTPSAMTAHRLYRYGLAFKLPLEVGCDAVQV